MTLKQGEDINKQFTLFTDSLNKAKEEVILSKKDILTLSIKNKILADSSEYKTKELEVSKAKIQSLEAELKLTKSQLLGDKRFTRRQTAIASTMLTAFTVIMSLMLR